MNERAPALDHSPRRREVADLAGGHRSGAGRLADAGSQVDRSAERPSASPEAIPTWTCGNDAPSASAAATRSSEATSSAAASGAMSITPSPSVLVTRTGETTMSLAISSKRSATRPSSSGSTSWPSRVKPTRSAKANTALRVPGMRAPTCVTSSLAIALRRWMRATWLSAALKRGTVAVATSQSRSASSSSDRSCSRMSVNSASRVVSASAPSVRPMTRETCTTTSWSMPRSRNSRTSRELSSSTSL